MTSTAAVDDEQYLRQQEFSLDDMGNARRLVAMCGNSVRYSYIKNNWYCWDGKAWQEDITGAINRLNLQARLFQQQEVRKEMNQSMNIPEELKQLPQ